VSTGHIQKNRAVLKVIKTRISNSTLAKYRLSAAKIVRVSLALPAVLFSCLLRDRGTIFQDGIAAGEGFQCALL
jgi:hypothetical protein